MLNRVVTMAALAVGGMLLSKKLKGGGNIKSAASVEESIEVNVPVSAAYNQYIQFEDFPKFMSNVIEIRQLDGKHLHWRARVGLEEKEWDAEITEQILDKRVAWRSVSGPRNGGVATFHKISDNATRIMVQMDYEPDGVSEKLGDAMSAVRMELRTGLQSLKEMLEKHGETGAWRGKIAQH